MHTVLEILRKTEAWFAEKGVPRARLDAEHLLAHVLGCGRLELYLRHDMPMTEEHLADLRPLVRRRASREPLQHILGTWDFHNLNLKIDRRALVPRQETEQLVEEILALAPEPPPGPILDLGTGGGAILLALLQAWPDLLGIGVDASQEALTLAKENAAHCGLQERVSWVHGEWFTPLDRDTLFGLIVSNPPYLTEEEWTVAEPEVREFDPKPALVAAENGLADAKTILSHAKDHLNPDAWVCLETGITQHATLEDHARSLGYQHIQSRKDFSQRPRFFFAKQ